MIHDELIARLEAAPEGSRELDAAVYAAVSKEPTAEDKIAAMRKELGREPGDIIKSIIKDSDDFAHARPPSFTTSLDAALTLVPEGMAADVHIGPRAIYNQATIWLPIKGKDEQGRRTTSYEPLIAGCAREGTLYQNSPALAVCIAVLKARLVAG